MRTTFDFKFCHLFSKIDTPESFTVLFFTTKVSTLISIKGGQAPSRLLNDKISDMTVLLKLIVN